MNIDTDVKLLVELSEDKGEVYIRFVLEAWMVGRSPVAQMTFNGHPVRCIIYSTMLPEVFQMRMAMLPFRQRVEKACKDAILRLVGNNYQF